MLEVDAIGEQGRTGIEGEVEVIWVLWVDLDFYSDFASPPWRLSFEQSRLDHRYSFQLPSGAKEISCLLVEWTDQLRETTIHPRRRVVGSSLGAQSVS